MALKQTKAAALAATLITFGSLAEEANGAVLVLDNVNGYSVTVAAAFTISQLAYSSGVGAVFLTGATATLGVSTVADFSSDTFTFIGGGSNPGGYTPEGFVRNSIAFTIRDDNTLKLYDATITYFSAPGIERVTVGIPPSPNNTAGLVVDVTAAIPEPSTTFLLGLGALGFVARRKRAI